MYKFLQRESTLILIIAIGLIIFLGIAASAKAQVTVDSTTSSNSNAAAGSQSGSVAISGGGGGGTGASNFTIVPQSTVSINSTGSDLGEAIPITTAPPMTVLGGEDSCLKSRSGGVGVSGFGGSFGTMVMDNECNRRRMHSYMKDIDPRIAMAILCGSPVIWSADSRASKYYQTSRLCHNDQPESADEIDPNLADERDTAYSYPLREDEGLFD